MGQIKNDITIVLKINKATIELQSKLCVHGDTILNDNDKCAPTVGISVSQSRIALIAERQSIDLGKSIAPSAEWMLVAFCHCKFIHTKND